MADKSIAKVPAAIFTIRIIETLAIFGVAGALLTDVLLDVFFSGHRIHQLSRHRKRADMVRVERQTPALFRLAFRILVRTS